MTDLAKNIKRLRKAKNMTQADLAERLHVTRQTVSSWERGNSNPDLSMLAAIAEALDTDQTTLLYPGSKSEKEPFRPGGSFVFGSVFLYVLFIRITGYWGFILGPIAFMAICTCIIVKAIHDK